MDISIQQFRSDVSLLELLDKMLMEEAEKDERIKEAIEAGKKHRGSSITGLEEARARDAKK